MLTLEERMKEYERVQLYRLTKRLPVIIRVDGNAFHTFTRGFREPFDNLLRNTFEETMLAVAKDIQGCVLAYNQSDEISFLLVDYQTLETDSWFDYKLTKLSTITASKTTMYFNKIFHENLEKEIETLKQDITISSDIVEKLIKIYKSRDLSAVFDGRAFNIPKEDVNNYFVWRQQDAIRNSLEATSRHYYGHKVMHKINSKQMLSMLNKKNIEQFNIDRTLITTEDPDKNNIWINLEKRCQHGSVVYKTPQMIENGKERMKFAINNEVIFKDNDIVDKLILK